jgi:hypothetical protein
MKKPLKVRSNRRDDWLEEFTVTVGRYIPIDSPSGPDSTELVICGTAIVAGSETLA